MATQKDSPTQDVEKSPFDQVGVTIKTKEARNKELRDDVKRAIKEAQEDKARFVKTLKEQPEIFSVNQHLRVDPVQFRANKHFMKKAVRRFIKRDSARIQKMYLEEPDRMPLNFSSNASAQTHLERTKKLYLDRQATEEGKNKPDNRRFVKMEEAIEIFIESRLGATAMKFEGFDTPTLMMYDYDKKVYVFDQNFMSRWLTVLYGSAPANQLKTFIMTLQGMSHHLAIYEPLPRWKIAVGNGIFNTVTRQLEPYTPREVVLNRIETNYNANAIQPKLVSGMTFEKLVSDLANDKRERIELIMQMCKSIVTGYTTAPAIFVAIGSGGDGKSLFMSLLSNVIGAQNTGSMNFSDMDDDSKVVEVAQKRLVVGMDNNHNTRIKNTALLKSAASREVTSFFRKFLPSVSLKFTGTIVQLCNTLPNFGESGSAIRRRIITILCENSHYENGDEKFGLQENIKNKHWHEYVLKTILDEDTNPYFTDYNDCDKAVLNNALDAEDSIGSFYEELASQNVFNEDVQVLPRSLLYSAFKDWMARNYPSAHVHTAKSFSTKSNDFLREYGFVTSDAKPMRLSTLSTDYDLDFEMLFGYLVEGNEAKKTLEASSPTRVTVRDGSAKVRKAKARQGGRNPRKCDAITYFNMWDNIVSDIEHNPEAYRDLMEEFKMQWDFIDESRPATTDNEYGVNFVDDETLDLYFEASYEMYLDDHNIEDMYGDKKASAHFVSDVSFGERMLQTVAEQTKNYQKNVKKEAPVSHDPLEVDYKRDQNSVIQEAPDSEVFANIDELVERMNDEVIAQKVMNLSIDLTGAVMRKDEGYVEEIRHWISICKDFAQKNPSYKISYASIIDRLYNQLITYTGKIKDIPNYELLQDTQDEGTDSKEITLDSVIDQLIED